MSQLKVDLNGKSLRADVVQKKLRELFGENVLVTVSKYEPPTSRSDRFAEAESNFESAKGEVESLKDELQEWYDNLPENFQNGDKGDQLQEAISTLENLHSELDGIDFSAPDFPSMF